MNKNIVVGVVVLIILVGGISFLYMQQDGMAGVDESMTRDQGVIKEESMMKDDSLNKDMMGAQGAADSQVMDKGDDSMKAGQYEAYAPEKVARASTGTVILFFKASWCPSCRAADADITANISRIPAGVSILTVDYDTATDLKKRYGVTSQHTFVRVDAEGNEIKQWSGGLTLAAVLGEVQ